MVEPPTGSSQPPTQQEVIVIQPAQPNTVYVPSYNPTVVYGSSWPYPSYPPYYAAPPPGYYFGTALATGLAFAAGAAVVGGLWGWASPAWGGGYANVNVNRYNNINVNRAQITSSRWSSATGGGRATNFSRAPGGPVGLPGRSQVSVPGSAVRPPTRAGGIGGVGSAGGVGGQVGLGASGGQVAPAVSEASAVRVVRVAWPELAVAGGVGGAGRPGGPGSVGGFGGAGRPGGMAGVGGAGGIGGAGRSTRQPTGGAGAQRPGGAFGDISGGRQAGQFGQRGAQSRSVAQRQSFGGGRRAGGGGRSGGGRGGRR